MCWTMFSNTAFYQGDDIVQTIFPTLWWCKSVGIILKLI